jgi:E3 ubiquitin-protein ligase RNF5
LKSWGLLIFSAKIIYIFSIFVAFWIIMEDETQNTMNLDLNLGPVVDPDDDDDETITMNLEEWLNGPVQIIREALRQRDAVRRSRTGQRWRSDWSHSPQSIPARPTGGNGLETGEGSVAAEIISPIESTKTCENTHGFLNGELGDKKDVEKSNGEDGSFFDCNICLDLARDPIVTCCGHLFCWPCIYRWLNVHSEAKECPICKGEVTIKNVTPIYGRGNCVVKPGEDPNLKIPDRPPARRVESWRQSMQRNAYALPMDEMIRRLGNRFDLTRDLNQALPDGPMPELPERSHLLLNRILTSRGLRREQFVPSGPLPTDDVVDLTGESQIQTQTPSQSQRRPYALRPQAAATRLSRIERMYAERVGYSYFHNHNSDEQIQIPAVDDRDSVSSIAAVIQQSESQTVDTAIEIDSTVSSSRRRYDGSSRVSDVDSGDSRAYRRRRLNNPN